MSALAKPSLQKEKGEVVSLKHWKVKFIWSVAQMQGHSAGKIQVHNKFHLSVSIQKTPTKGKNGHWIFRCSNISYEKVRKRHARIVHKTAFSEFV